MLTGCAEASEETTPASAAAAADPSGGGTQVAERGGTIGAAGSACELPVTFAIAEVWTAEAVEKSSGGATYRTSPRTGQGRRDHHGPRRERWAGCADSARPEGPARIPGSRGPCPP
ncbi:lipoprotein [Streptomyces sp. NPDC001617]